MATATARPEVFTRKASGLVRVMSPFSAFVYNILTMGLIFPWTYLWAPGALLGGNLVWGILLATLIEIPIAYAYVCFAPLFLGLGATMGNATLSSLGVWFTTAPGIIITSIVNALLSLVLLVSGFKNYVRFQHVMWWGTLLAFAVVFFVLFTTPPSAFVERLNAFSVASGGVENFYH